MTRQELFKLLSDKNGDLNSYQCGKITRNVNLNDIQTQIRNAWKTNFPKCESIKELFYWLKHDLYDRPKCPVCGNDISFELSTSSYHDHCSCVCTQLDKVVREKQENTMLKLYNVRNAIHCQEFVEKMSQTNLKKFGVDNVFKSDFIKEKIKETNIKKYGSENPQQNDCIKKKTRKTMVKRYGCEFATQNHDIRIKCQCKYRYNNEHFDSSLEIAYYIYLTDNNIQFIHNPKVDFTYNHDNKVYKYFPDFLLVESNKYVEIKGDQFFNPDGTMCNPYDHSMDSKCEAKHQCMIQNNVQIIKDSDMSEVKKHISEKFGSYDFLKDNFKIVKEPTL